MERIDQVRGALDEMAGCGKGLPADVGIEGAAMNLMGRCYLACNGDFARAIEEAMRYLGRAAYATHFAHETFEPRRKSA